MSDLSRAALKSAADALGLALNNTQLKTLGRYAGLLRDWNQRMNLISRGDTDRILSYHVTDSLAVSRLIPADSRVADIGTGAGLPGIPLAVARPDVEMLLVESSHKKCLFLTAAVQELGLDNAHVKEARAESLEPLDCNVILSRLTGPLKLVVKQVHKHVAPGGRFILYKTVDCGGELALAAKTLARCGLSVQRIAEVVLPESGILRRFIVLVQNQNRDTSHLGLRRFAWVI